MLFFFNVNSPFLTSCFVQRDLLDPFSPCECSELSSSDVSIVADIARSVALLLGDVLFRGVYAKVQSTLLNTQTQQRDRFVLPNTYTHTHTHTDEN